MKCVKCFDTFFAVGVNEMRRHLEMSHSRGEIQFDERFLEWKCRACPDEEMDNREELSKHLEEKHKQKPISEEVEEDKVCTMMLGTTG